MCVYVWWASCICVFVGLVSVCAVSEYVHDKPDVLMTSCASMCVCVIVFVCKCG